MTSAAAARKSFAARLKRREQAKRASARRMVQAREQLVLLIKKLGGVCVECGETGASAPLSVDHVDGLQWPKPHNYYRFDIRVRRYWAEYEGGVRLKVLCVPCNSARGRPKPEDLEEPPF